MKMTKKLVMAAASAIFLPFFANADYAPIEWIQGSGSAWIYSGYKPNPTDRLEMKLRATDIGVTDALFCARGPTSHRVNMFVATRIGSNFRIDFGNNDGNMKTLSTPVVNTATDYLLVLDGNAMRGWVASVDSGEELGSTGYTARPTPAGPIALYAAHTLGAGLSASTPLSSMAAFGTFRMYWCKVYDASGALVRHWVPAEDCYAAADAVGRYGVIDLCTNEFFPCLGNAQFTPGPRIRTMGTFIYVR